MLSENLQRLNFLEFFPYEFPMIGKIFDILLIIKFIQS